LEEREGGRDLTLSSNPSPSEGEGDRRESDFAATFVEVDDLALLLEEFAAWEAASDEDWLKLEYSLALEAIRERSQMTQEQAEMLADEIDAAGWERLQDNWLQEGSK
jgi:hypothetical protein